MQISEPSIVLIGVMVTKYDPNQRIGGHVDGRIGIITLTNIVSLIGTSGEPALAISFLGTVSLESQVSE